MRSTAEFAILAFVVYPLLPPGSVRLPVGGVAITVEPRVVWLMVVSVAGLGIVNYAVVRSYGGRGVAVTGFFGGLASSTAVVGTMLDHVRRDPAAARYGVAAILLADAAMALRNLLVAVAFTVTTASTLVEAAVPLGAIAAVAAVVAVVTADWSREVDLELEAPFSMRNALGFGALFLLVVLAGGVAETVLGRLGLYVTAALTGLVSSAGATTSAVVLYRGGTLDADAAVVAVLLATLASVAVKAALAVTGGDRAFARAVLLRSALLVAVGAAATALVV